MWLRPSIEMRRDEQVSYAIIELARLLAQIERDQEGMIAIAAFECEHVRTAAPRLVVPARQRRLDGPQSEELTIEVEERARIGALFLNIPDRDVVAHGQPRPARSKSSVRLRAPAHGRSFGIAVEAISRYAL